MGRVRYFHRNCFRYAYMKIVADCDIPFVGHYFGSLGELVLCTGRNLNRELVHTADILLVRSVTKVNQALLQGTAVKWVGSVSTGQDHLDTAWLTAEGIRWATTAGFNSIPVVEYVFCVIACLQKKGVLPPFPFKA